jgi:saccharopine dehydrogenase-like NADP-dependent oxidoreductase
MVGSVMAADLAADGDFDVTIADADASALEAANARAGGRLATFEADLSDPVAVKKIVADADVVLGALASTIAYEALRAVIEAGRPCCDIAFMPQNPLDHDELARARGVTAVVDCGVAPGLSNMLAGAAVAQLGECERIEIYVGGVPRHPEPPFFYKAAFSPADVIEEYTRPARFVEQGVVVEREALSEVEPIEFEDVGTLEAFNTDGLRSLIETLNVPDMKEKTLRHPGHVELMRAFREAGLFGLEPVTIGGVVVRPRDVTAAVLFPRWAYTPGEEDLTVLRVSAEGSGRRLAWEMVDSYDRKSSTTSMARTTAFPCVITARMIAAGRLTTPGVIPPERLGEDPGLLEHMLAELDRRGVRVRET